MPTFYDSRSQPYVLAERIGSGGEGTVYSCEDYKLVAKIYHEPITEDKTEKLRWMAANKNEQLLKVAAWVVDVLHDAPDGKVVGFLMSNIRAKEIHELYSLKSRRVHFPEATWHFLVHTATNLARAFHNLHRNGHIMGDINHGNCVVLADGTVKLIDCDSYSIKTDKMRYRCEVGVTTHLAPELQGVNLSDVERLDKHDNFGLAVIIFQLLFLGRHPFAGNFSGEQDKSLEDCIREFRFAYGEGASVRKVQQPPGTLSLSALSLRVGLMFERAFLTDDRPEPHEWIEALEDLSGNLEQCSLHPGHLYFAKLAACPWCEIESKTGLMLFPFITSGSHLNGEKLFNIFTVENLITSLGISKNLPAKPPQPSLILPSPSSEIIEARKESRKMTFIIIPAHFLGLILLMVIFGVGVAFYLGIILTIVSIAFINNSDTSIRRTLEETLSDTEQKWEKAEDEWIRMDTPQVINDDLTRIRKKVGDYQKIQQQSIHQIKLLETNVARRELYKFLHSKSITKADVPGITERQLKVLFGKGVKNAAEIEENRLLGFLDTDNELVTKLIAWRRRLESDFEKDARASEILQAEKTQFARETAGERRNIEKEIERLLTLLRFSSMHHHKRQQQLYLKSEELGKRILQTKSDLETIGTNIPAIVFLILVMLLTPLFGLVTGFNSSRARPLPARTGYDGYGSASTYSAPMPNSAAVHSQSILEMPDENITDAAINDLSASDRQRFAETLYYQSIDYNYEDADYVKAEQKIRLALRLKKDEPRLLNQLGFALYQQGRSTESLYYLNRSLNLDKEKIETKIFIGINHLKSKRFSDARKILLEVTGKDSSFEGFHNLGLAYVGLKDYTNAVTAFQVAAKVNPTYVDSHYQLGYCFNKLGKKEDAGRQYSILLKLDEAVAEKLRKEANIY